MREGEGGVFREPAAEAPLHPPGRRGTLRPPRLVLTVFLLLPAGCGSTLYLTMKGTSPRPPAEVSDCVKSQLKVLGYTLTSVDVKDQRISARKSDDETQVSDTRLEKNYDRLSIEVGKSGDGGAQLSVGAHTFSRVSTHAGPWETEQEASPAVKAAAQALLEACGK